MAAIGEDGPVNPSDQDPTELRITALFDESARLEQAGVDAAMAPLEQVVALCATSDQPELHWLAGEALRGQLRLCIADGRSDQTLRLADEVKELLHRENDDAVTLELAEQTMVFARGLVYMPSDGSDPAVGWRATKQQRYRRACELLLEVTERLSTLENERAEELLGVAYDLHGTLLARSGSRLDAWRAFGKSYERGGLQWPWRKHLWERPESHD